MASSIALKRGVSSVSGLFLNKLFKPNPINLVPLLAPSATHSFNCRCLFSSPHPNLGDLFHTSLTPEDWRETLHKIFQYNFMDEFVDVDLPFGKFFDSEKDVNGLLHED